MNIQASYIQISISNTMKIFNHFRDSIPLTKQFHTYAIHYKTLIQFPFQKSITTIKPSSLHILVTNLQFKIESYKGLINLYKLTNTTTKPFRVKHFQMRHTHESTIALLHTKTRAKPPTINQFQASLAPKLDVSGYHYIQSYCLQNDGYWTAK